MEGRGEGGERGKQDEEEGGEVEEKKKRDGDDGGKNRERGDKEEREGEGGEGMTLRVAWPVGAAVPLPRPCNE